jgi:hypothetical protein
MSRSAHTFLPKNKLVAGMGIGAIAMLAMAGPALTRDEKDSKKDEVFQVKTVIQVPGATSFFSFDISWFDFQLNKYFLADRNNKAIDVIDPENLGGGVTQFPNPGFAGVNAGGNDFSGPDGVLTANKSTELWVGDSPGKVWIMNAKTGAIPATLGPQKVPNPIVLTNPQTGKPQTSRADELCYDPNNNVIMIASPAEGPKPFVTFISATTYKVLGTLVFDGKAAPNATNGIEQCQWSPRTELFYQNVPEVDGPGNDTAPGKVAVIDPKKMTVKKSFTIPLDACAGPQGMAIGPDDQILLGCNAAGPDGHRNSVVINENNGTILKHLPNLGGADEVWFNKDDGHYSISSCNTPCRTVPVTGATTGPELLGIVDANGLRLDHTVTTAEQNGLTSSTVGGNPRTAHSVAAGGNLIFLPLPAVGGNVPQFDPSLCDSFDDSIARVGNPTSLTGCIVVLRAKGDKDDRSRVAHERDRDDRQD